MALRRFICRLLIGVLVSTQMAIAAYACSGMAKGGTVVAMADMDRSADAAMGSAGMDPMLPNLCVGHCRYGHQNVDHKPAPGVPAALLTRLYTIPPVSRDAGDANPLEGRSPSAAPDPPHTILHCCLRD